MHGDVEDALKSGRVEFEEADLLDPTAANRAMSDMQVVFHLAATHGGRGYVNTRRRRALPTLRWMAL